MACCNEHGCTRKQPFKIRRAPFSKRIVLITDYRTRPNNLLVANRKHDITDELVAFLESEGWTPPPPEAT
jgi:hypothetical protein